MPAAALTENLHAASFPAPGFPARALRSSFPTDATGPEEAAHDDAAPFPLWLVPFAIVLAPVVLLVVAVFPAFVSARELSELAGATHDVNAQGEGDIR